MARAVAPGTPLPAGDSEPENALGVLRDELEERASGPPLAVPDAAREQEG